MIHEESTGVVMTIHGRRYEGKRLVDRERSPPWVGSPFWRRAVDSSPAA